MFRTIAISLALSLAACGYKGPLEKPSGPAPKPLLGISKPASSAPAEKIDSNISTDKKPLSL